MPDRTLFTLALLPLLAAALLLLAFTRGPSVRAAQRTAASAPARRVTSAAPRGPWLGVIVASHSAELASDIDGRVSEVWAAVGARVRRGQPILRVDASDAQHAEALAGAELGQRRSEVLRAEARLEEARARRQRLEQGGTWIAAQELEAARAVERMAQADVLAARAGVGMGRAKVAQQRLRARRHTLLAPFDGVLVSCDADPGDSVASGQTVARVMTDAREVRFAVPREQLSGGALREVLLSLPDARLRAEVAHVSPEVDPAAQLVFASATPTVPSPELVPGTRVEVFPVEVGVRASEER